METKGLFAEITHIPERKPRGPTLQPLLHNFKWASNLMNWGTALNLSVAFKWTARLICGHSPNQVIGASRVFLFFGPPRDGDEVDAVAVASTIREVVAEVSAVHAHGLAVGKTSHQIPVDLLVPERRPPVGHGFFDELGKGPPPWPVKERLSRVGIVEGNFPRGIALFLKKAGRLPIARVLCVVPTVLENV